jgi:hypothetical protein
MKLELIRENIFKLLENETKFNQGDTVTTQKDGDGTVLLAKHPYYSIQLNSTGVTKSYHFTDLNASEPIESEFGKYELEEIIVNNPTKFDYETWRNMMVSKKPSIVINILKIYGFNSIMSLPEFFKKSTTQEIAKTYKEVSKLEDWSINEIIVNKPVKKIDIVNNRLSDSDINKLDLKNKLGIIKIYRNHITLTPLYDDDEYNLKFISDKLNRIGIKHNVININNYGPGIKISSKYY